MTSWSREGRGPYEGVAGQAAALLEFQNTRRDWQSKLGTQRRWREAAREGEGGAVGGGSEEAIRPEWSGRER